MEKEEKKDDESKPQVAGNRRATYIKVPKELVDKIKKLKGNIMEDFNFRKKSGKNIPHYAVIEKLVDEAIDSK